MNDNPALLFLQCIALPFIVPAFAAGFWLGKRYQAYGFPGMFIPSKWRQ